MIHLILASLRDLLRPRHDLILENLALRQQILVLERSGAHPRLRASDKAFWVALSHCWRHWRRPLRLVKPSTVIAWHRKGWRLYWRWKSRPGNGGRPGVPIATIDLIRRISHENPLWGAPRIHGELLMLGIKVSEATIAKYMITRGKPPSQNWQTFIRNHLPDIAAIDFLTIPTVTFGTLYVLIFLSLDRRKVIHFNVTDAPSAYWTSLQLLQAFPFDTAPRFKGAITPDHDRSIRPQSEAAVGPTRDRDEIRVRDRNIALSEVVASPRDDGTVGFQSKAV
jgi:hypothetical protein